MSCTVPFSAWPMCSSPVMFGGGRQIVYLGLGLFGFAVKRPAFSQSAYQPASTACGSYAVGMDDLVSVVIWACSDLCSWGLGGAGGGSLTRTRRRGYGYFRYAAHGAQHLNSARAEVRTGSRFRR